MEVDKWMCFAWLQKTVAAYSIVIKGYPNQWIVYRQYIHHTEAFPKPPHYLESQ